MDPETQALIDAAMNGTPAGDAAATATPTAGSPAATATPAAGGTALSFGQRYILLKGTNGIDYSVDLTTGTATPIKGLPGQATPIAMKLVKAPDGSWQFVDPANPTSPAIAVQGMPAAPAKNVPGADQIVPGTGTPEVPAIGGSTGDLSTAMGDAYVPSKVQGIPATPDVTVAVNDSRTRAAAQANTATNDAEARRIAAARLAMDQTNAELNRGRQAITDAYNNKQLDLEQSKAAADLLYKQADIEFRARIADQTFGQNVADTEMKRLPAGTLAATGQAWQSATQGKYVPAQLPPDNRDPVQIALNAIAQLKAGQGPTPAANALQNYRIPGLTLQAQGTGTGNTTTGGGTTQPVAGPSFPQMGSPIGRY